MDVKLLSETQSCYVKIQVNINHRDKETRQIEEGENGQQCQNQVKYEPIHTSELRNLELNDGLGKGKLRGIMRVITKLW